MALFNKKKKQEEASAAVNEKEFDYKEAVLKALDEKLNGSTLYDGCIIMPRGFTIDVKIGRRDEKDGIKLVQVVFLVSHDDFDEPIIDPVDAQGKDEAEAVHMAVEIFYGGLWHPLDQSMFKKSPIEVSAQFLGQHYTYDMYAQSIVRIGVQDKEPTMLVGFLQNEIPKYLGSKKYYWIEVRVNGSGCNERSEKFRPYVDAWDASEHFICEKQYAIFVQRGDDPCPYKKEVYTNAAKFAIEKMVKIKNREDYEAMADELEKVAGDKAVASEIRIFIPEILAKLTLGFREGDSLFLMEGEGEDTTQIEFKKSQLRSYFYLQQAVLEYFNTKPSQEDVTKIVTNSVAFRELRKAIDQAKENGQEIKPSDLFVPGTSYKINVPDYKVW